ncbi:MAG: pyridoxamine 5'-phosphate oxidase family protein [Candidatus Omnitrophica bacterium]|nr:pyridoxamine 5'-phosphate oxidase family protein [Candidatus Omnitrophota bacterium]
MLDRLQALLKGKEFISLATANLDGEPHATPKFIFKIKRRFIYLIDYAIAKSAENLRQNPRAALSFMDLTNLEGYRISGSAQLIEGGKAFERIVKEFDRKLIKLSADRFIEGLKTGKKHEHYELEIPRRFVVIKVTAEEMVKVGRDGELTVERAHGNANRGK